MEFSGINFMILLFVCCCYKYVYFVWIWKSKQIWKESKQIFCLPTFDVHKQWIFRTFFTLNCLMLPMLTSVHCKGLKLAEGLKINEFLTKFPIIVNKNSSFLGWGTRFCCDAKSALLTLYILKYRISPSVRPVCVCVPFVVKAAGVFWPGSSKPEDKVGELLLRDSCLPHQKGRFFVHKNWKFRWKIVNF